MLLLAIFLWLFVVTGREYEEVEKIPLVIANLKPDKMLVNEIPKEVEVRFRGSGRALLGLHVFTKAVVELNLSTINFFYDYPLSIDLVEISSGGGLTPLEIVRPDSVRIILDEIHQAELRVIPDMYIKPAAGFIQVGEVKVSPAKLKVTGPFQVLSAIKRITTERVEFKEAKRNIREKVPLHFPHPKVSAEIQEVTITADIEKLTEMLFKNISVRVLNPPTDIEVQLHPPAVAVKISGPLSVLKKITPDQIAVTVDFPRREMEEITGLHPIVKLPEGAELISVAPDTLSFTLVLK